MARGDGKAQRGYTRGKGVIKMAAGGNLAARDAAMGGAAVGSRAEATRSTSSGGLGAGSGGFGASTREGGFGGAGRSYPDDRRVDLRGNPNTFSRTERTSALTSPDSMKARLGPNAAQAMVDAGLDPETARLAADSISRRAIDSPSILGDRNPGQRLATANRDGSFTYSPIQSSTIAKNQKKQIYDRIMPNEPNRTLFPSAAPVGTLGSFGPAATRSITTAAPPAPAYGTPKFRSSYEDQQSIVPGSVTFKQEKTFTPFAQTKAGMSLLEKSKSPLTVEQAKALKSQFPEGSSIALAGGKAPPGTTAYPATVGGFKVDVFVPKNAGVTTLGPKVGQFNPSFQPSSSLANYNGQEQRFAPAPAIRGQEQRFRPAAPSERPTAGIQTPPAPAGASSPPSVVAGNNFTAGAFPYRDRGGEGGRRRRKKPIIEETETMKSGGRVCGTDGIVSRGKTRGRYI